MSIRLIEHRDAEIVFATIERNRDYLSQWMSWVSSTRTLADIEQFIKRSLHDYADRKGAVFVITQGGEFCGLCGFNAFDFSCGWGRIGYWLDSQMQGRVLMTAAIGELLEYAFNTLGLEMCDIRAAVDNHKSRAVAERLGFTCTGTLRRAENVDGDVIDHAIYSLLKSEWQNR